MISKLIEINNLGLLKKGIQTRAVDFEKVTAIYADNGRGKSTLSSVFRSCSLKSIDGLMARKTLDIDEEPKLRFLINSNKPFEYENESWQGEFPEVEIFDAEFVDTNVYSGFRVHPEQKKSLLEFALGQETVVLKNHIEQVVQKIKQLNTDRRHAENVINSVRGPFTLENYVEHILVENIEQKIKEKQQRAQEAQRIEEYNRRSNPTKISLISFDLDGFRALMAKSIDDVHENADTLVKNHFIKCECPGIEDWIDDGQVINQGDFCPFCGQSTRGLELIEAYKTYFNESYNSLKREIESYGDELNKKFSDQYIGSLKNQEKINTTGIEQWAEQFEIKKVDIDLRTIKKVFDELSELLKGIIESKKLNPIEAIDTSANENQINDNLKEINALLEKYNESILVHNKIVEDFKSALDSENVQTINSVIAKLQALSKKSLAEVSKACEDYKSIKLDKADLEEEKTSTRANLDTLMSGTLGKYCESINEILINFGAAFSISDIKPSYKGGDGTLTSEYFIEVRNTPVKLLSKSDVIKEPHFGNVLSEGDKRTLAIAFFIAKLEADNNLSDKVIVFDDPVSSFDRNRRNKTLLKITKLARACKQLILLSHDAYFIQKFIDSVSRPTAEAIESKVLEIKRSRDNYSSVCECELDKLCASQYVKDHKLISDFLDANHNCELSEIAKTIRTLLEGYYKRRFPADISRKDNLGDILALVRNAKDSNPLMHLRDHYRKISEINDFSSQYHHSNSEGCSESELSKYAEDVLNLIYSNE